MAKRFVDSRRYQDPWFRKLSPKYKCFWDYILNACSHAGVWKVDMDLAIFSIGDSIDLEEAIQLLNGRIKVVSKEKWFIPGFVRFQYNTLNPAVAAHKSVLLELMELGLEDFLIKEGLGNSSPRVIGTLKDKDKDKVKDKVKEIVEDLNIVCKTQYKYTTPKTIDLIKVRLNEGHTVEDFKVVHRNKFEEWGNDTKMMKFLRPETLYSNKFEGYRNQKQSTSLDDFCKKLGVKADEQPTYKRQGR